VVFPACALCCQFLIAAFKTKGFVRFGAVSVVVGAYADAFVEFRFADVLMRHPGSVSSELGAPFRARLMIVRFLSWMVLVVEFNEMAWDVVLSRDFLCCSARQFFDLS
jgi:hypothetical protein